MTSAPATSTLSDTTVVALSLSIFTRGSKLDSLCKQTSSVVFFWLQSVKTSWSCQPKHQAQYNIGTTTSFLAADKILFFHGLQLNDGQLQLKLLIFGVVEWFQTIFNLVGESTVATLTVNPLVFSLLDIYMKLSFFSDKQQQQHILDLSGLNTRIWRGKEHHIVLPTWETAKQREGKIVLQPIVICHGSDCFRGNQSEQWHVFGNMVSPTEVKMCRNGNKMEIEEQTLFGSSARICIGSPPLKFWNRWINVWCPACFVSLWMLFSRRTFTQSLCWAQI